jgi:hypothetical protein
MDLNALRAFALELIPRQPAAFVDLVNCQVNRFNQTQMKTQKMPQNIANVDAVLQCQHNWKTNVVHKQDSLA